MNFVLFRGSFLYPAGDTTEMFISVIVPAFNEERYLGETLARINRANALLQKERGIQGEIIVVDNNSDDGRQTLPGSLVQL